MWGGGVVATMWNGDTVRMEELPPDKPKVPYLEFNFRQRMSIPKLSGRARLEVIVSFAQAMLDGVRRICMGNGGGARNYFSVGVNKRFPADWTTKPPLIVADQIYAFGIAGITVGSVTITMDGVTLATDFNTRTDSYLTIGSYGQNQGGNNFSGRIFAVRGFNSSGTMINNYIPALNVNGRPCLKDEIRSTTVYSETADPIYGVGDFVLPS